MRPRPDRGQSGKGTRGNSGQSAGGAEETRGAVSGLAGAAPAEAGAPVEPASARSAVGSPASGMARSAAEATEPYQPGTSSNPFAVVATIRRIFGYAKTIAVVGLSPNKLRPSYFVASYLQYRGYHIVPVNPTAGEILGETSYPSLRDIPCPVDVVDVFRDPAAVPEIAEQAIEIGAKALWLQFNVVAPEAAARAQAAGLDVVMDRCMKIEHGRWYGEMHWFGLNTGIVTGRRPQGNRMFSQALTPLSSERR